MNRRLLSKNSSTGFLLFHVESCRRTAFSDRSGAINRYGATNAASFGSDIEFWTGHAVCSHPSSQRTSVTVGSGWTRIDKKIETEHFKVNRKIENGKTYILNSSLRAVQPLFGSGCFSAFQFISIFATQRPTEDLSSQQDGSVGHSAMSTLKRNWNYCVEQFDWLIWWLSFSCRFNVFEQCLPFASSSSEQTRNVGRWI